LGQAVQEACVTAFKKLKTPRGLRDWYGKAISVIPDPGPTMQQALSTGKQCLPAQLLSQGLTTVQNATDFATEHSLSESCVYWTADSAILQQLSSPLKGAAHSVLKDTPCQCLVIRERYGTTVGGCMDHVVLRSHCDWKALFGQDFVDVLTRNARNQFIPDSDSVSERMDGLRSSLLELSLPSLMACPGGISAHMFVDKGVLSSQVVHEVTTQVCEKICAELKDQTAAHPWLDSAQVPQIRKVSKQLGLRLGVWDKKLTRISGVCQKLYDMRTVDSLLCGDRFQLFGWAPDDAQAKAAVCSITLQRAREAQILDDAKKLGLSRRIWHTPEAANEFFTEAFLCPQEGTRYPSAPSLFSLIK